VRLRAYMFVARFRAFHGVAIHVAPEVAARVAAAIMIPEGVDGGRYRRRGDLLHSLYFQLKGIPIVIAKSFLYVLMAGLTTPLHAQTPSPPVTLFQNVRIFDGKAG